jgi:His/Glu/Gln/Arg/opine family amino acid ABC transporter permease subunit
MQFDLGAVASYWPMFLKGLLVTLQVSAVGALLGIVVGVILLLARRSAWMPVRVAVRVYVSYFRGTPLIVQIFFAYYALPGLLHVDIPAYWAGVLALGLNSSAFVSEILRGSLSAIPKGQFEASHALGLRPSSMWIRVVLPQVFRHALPPLTNEFTILVKATPPLAAITLMELTRTAQLVMNQTFRPVEAFAVACVLYFVVLFTLSTFATRLETVLRRSVR